MSTSCWTLKNKTHPNGYSRVFGKAAHRVFYEEFKGKIPAGYTIDHLCREKSCVNPEHLEAVTQKVNSFRAPNYVGNRTHCPRGHEYNELNTRINKKTNRRQCRPCNRLHQQKYFNSLRSSHVN